MKAKLTYTGIRVKDLDRSIAFYTKLLGMKEAGRTTIPGSKGEAVSLVSEDGGHALELNYYGKGSRFATPYSVGEGLDHLAFQVEDLEKFLAESGKAGAPVALRMENGSAKWAYVEDPNGIWLEIFA